MNKLWYMMVLCVCVLLLNNGVVTYAEEVSFETEIRQLSYLIWSQPTFSTQNPENDFLGLYRYQARAELRPDFYLYLSDFKFMLKPRVFYEYNWDNFGSSSLVESEATSDVYINEALFQAKLSHELFTSLGRENLQWGPSYLRTPSNPFFRDNGRDNPKKEVEGKDFLKAIYLPNDWLTMSLISNFKQAGLIPEIKGVEAEFKARHALKIDMVSTTTNSSVIFSKQEGGNTTLGGYLQATMSDALIMYLDASLNRGNSVLYPKLDPGHPLGGYFVRQYENDDELRLVGLAGVSYTLNNSATVSIEYMYNGMGYDSTEAHNYYDLRNSAANNINNPPLGYLARSNLEATFNPGSILLRQHYLFAQYLFTEMGSDLAYTLRWTNNLDDHSNMISAILEYAYNDNLQFFMIANYYNGNSNTEFASLFRGYIMMGYEYTF